MSVPQVSPFPLRGSTFTGPSAPIVPSRTPPVMPIAPLGGVPYALAPDVVAAQVAAGLTPPPAPGSGGGGSGSGGGSSSDCGCKD